MEQNGIIFYSKISPYDGDVTKNSALYSEEVDNNFFFLRGMDVDSLKWDESTKTLSLIKVDGTELSVNNIVRDTTYNVSYDKVNGILSITIDGKTENIEGFITEDFLNENVVTSVNNKTGDVVLVASDFSDIYSETEVDNALVLKADKTVTDAIDVRVQSIENKIDIKANIVDVYSKSDSDLLLKSKTDKTVTDAIDVRVTTAENEITTLKSSKTDKTVTDAIDVRVTTAEGDITVLETSVEGKADKTVTDAIDVRLTTAEGDITALETSVEGKADKTVTDAIDVRLTTAEGDITTLETSVEGKVDKTVTDAIDARVTTAEGDIALKANIADVYSESDIDLLLNKKTDKTVADAIDARLTTAEGNITALETIVEGKADKTVTDAINVRLTTAEDEITTLKSGKADKTVADAIDARLTTAEGNITVLETSVEGKVDKTVTDAIDVRVTTAENEITTLKSGKTDKTVTDAIDVRLRGVESDVVLKANISNTYTKSDSDLLLNKKADKTVTDAIDVRVVNLENNAINKVDKTVTDAIDVRLTTAEGDITVLETSVEGKVDKTVTDAIDVRLTTAEGDITALETSVEGKADKTVTDAIDVRLTTAEGDITALETSVEGKADKTVTDAIDVRLTTAEGDIALKANATEVYSESDVDLLLSKKADKTIVDGISGVVLDMEKELSNVKLNKTDKTVTDAIDARVTTAEGDITALETSVEGKTDKTVTETLEIRLGEVEDNIILKANAVDVYTKSDSDLLLKSKTDKTVTDAIDARVTTAEGDITALETSVEGKQGTLVSGTNIKTINGESLLGNGNIDVSGGGSGESQVYSVNGKTGNVNLIAEDINDVYSKNEVLDLINIKYFELNGFIDSTGAFIENEFYVATPFIGINPELTITTTRRSNVEGLYFFDKYYSPISAYTTIEFDTFVTLKMDEIIIPDGAVFVRCSALKSKYDNVFYINDKELLSINDSIINNQLISFPIKNEFVSTVGKFFSDDSYNRTPFLPIRDYNIYGRQTANTNLVYFYDINYNPISGAKSEIEDGIHKINLNDLTIPSNAEYCVICSYYNDNFQPYIAQITPQEVYSEIQKRESNIIDSLGSVYIKNGTVIVYDDPNLIKEGYINPDGNYFYQEGRFCIEKVVAPKGKIIYNGFLNSGASVVFYDINYNIISYINQPTPSYNFEIEIPNNTVYWSLSTTSSYPLGYTTITPYIDTMSTEDILTLGKDGIETSFEIINNMKTEEINLGALDVVNYGQENVKGNLTSTINGSEDFRIGFRFKINENPNVEAYNKEIVRFENEDGRYLSFNLRGSELTQLSGNDITPGRGDTNIITTPPIPRYSSGFELKSNVTGSLSYIYNTVLNDRTFVMPGVEDDNQLCYKPITGVDLFSIKASVLLNGEVNRATKSSEVQLIYEKYLDLKVGANDTSVYIKKGDVILHEVLNSDYTKYIDYINAIQNLNGIIIDDEILIEVNILDYLITRDGSKIQPFEAIVVTKYPTPDLGVDSFFYDSFPCYFTYSIDESWHTFEYLQSDGYGRVVIDGQYLNWVSPVNYKIPNISSYLGDFNVSFGYGVNIELSDLTIQKGFLNDVEFRSDNHYIISKYHPYLIHSYYHELINTEIKDKDFIRTFVSDGGDVPDKYAGPEGYGGDGNVNRDRVQLTNPTYIFLQGLNRLRDAGFIYPTKEECRRWATQGISDHRKMIVIDSDDHNSQLIFSDPKIRGIFSKYNAKITNAIELGYYIDESTPTKTYSAVDFIQNYCNDTNEHRLFLQKLLQAMLHQGWCFDIHGQSNGFDFQTHSYFEIEDVIFDALNICQYLGIDASSWCYAANRYTVNAIKMLEYNGFSYATTTRQELSGICHHPLYRPRYTVFGTDIEDWLFKIERNIF